MLEILEKTIRENIILNKLLGGFVGNEMILFTENKLDDVRISSGQRNQIETKIQAGNTTIGSFFKSVASGEIVITEAQKATLALLVDDLRNSVINTINIAEQTGNELQNQRNATLKDLKVFGRGKKALKSYTRNTRIP